MIEEFIKYYKNLNYNNLYNLLNCLKNYDFKSYYKDIKTVYYYYEKLKFENINFSNLKSNGSSNKETKYKFGPNADAILEFVEKELRNNNLHKSLLIWNPYLGISKNITRFTFSNGNDKDKQKDFSVMGYWSHNSHVFKLINLIDELYLKYAKINLVALPHIWICLSTNKIFRSWALENFFKINFVNSDYDLSIKKIDGVRIIDQMIDWKSGVNFYTCEYNVKHFFPFFFKINGNCYNLLNLTKENFYCDDIIKIGNTQKICKCGKYYLDFEIIPHYKNKITNGKEIIYFDSFYDKLMCKYNGLQIYQNYNNKIFICYSIDKSQEENFYSNDKEKIYNFFMQNSIEDIEFIENKYFTINKKRYSFWKSKKIDFLNYIFASINKIL